jgi:gliding motility-associated-like protein
MHRYLAKLFTIILVCTTSISAFAQLVNDEPDNAILITNTSAFCSDESGHTNLGATQSGISTPSHWTTIGGDVWFKFIAIKSDVNITVSGQNAPNSPNTLLAPSIALYIVDDFNPNIFSEVPRIVGPISSNNVTSLDDGGLRRGKTYLIRISSEINHTGTFKLCIDNFNPPLSPGQDFETASILCTKETFTQLNVSGAGQNSQEARGTCLTVEKNSAWYKFKASTAGSFTFTITPTDISNDMDWVMYDLGPDGGSENVRPENAIRCAAGSGVNCTPSYFKTGLSMSETDLNEDGGCGADKNGFVKFVELVPGHNYAILIENFSSGNNGFTMEFGGDAVFEGPKAQINSTVLNPCTDSQTFTFESSSSNYQTLNWTFDDGASIATGTGEGPFTIAYSTMGSKTVVLEAIAGNGCKVVSTHTFIVSKTPETPKITASKLDLCVGDVLELKTDDVNLATFQWTGPNGFTSTAQNPTINITGKENEGVYKLIVKVGICVSEESSIEIKSVEEFPVAGFDIVVRNKCEDDQFFEIVNKATGYNNIKWDLVGGATELNLPATGVGTARYLTDGIKKITQTLTTKNGCEVVLTKEILVGTKPPIPTITSNKQKFCLGDIIKLSVPFEEGRIYQWTGPDNFQGTGASVEIAVDNFEKGGIYQVTVLFNDCISNPASIEFPAITKTPIARFTNNPQFLYKFSPPLTVTFNNHSLYADFYTWDFGDGEVSEETSPKHTFTKEGTYRITLTATSKNNCATTITSNDLVLSNYSLLIPNAFSPNGDGVNDEFTVNVVNLQKYQLQVFNRNGSLVFSTYDIFENWKGTYKNAPAPVGAYYYVITGTDVDNKQVKKTGQLTIIR